MYIQPFNPSIEALKRSARRIKLDYNVKHNQALEIASRRNGFESFRHASKSYQDTIRVTAFCRFHDRSLKTGGFYEKSLLLNKAHAEIFSKDFKRKFAYHRKTRGLHYYETYWAAAWSENGAKNYVYEFLRRIQFATLTNMTPHLSPWQNGRSRKQEDLFIDPPWSDHNCAWKDNSTGGIINIQQPYPGKYDPDGRNEREEWANGNGYEYHEFNWSLYGHGTFMIGLSPLNNPVRMSDKDQELQKAKNPLGMVKSEGEFRQAPFSDDY